MQKQKKSFEKKYKNQFKFKKKFNKTKENLYFTSRIIQAKSFAPNKLNFQSVFFYNNRYDKILLSVTIKSNNIFCNLSNLSKKKILKSCSSGNYKLNTSRKKLKFNLNIVLNSFLNEIKTAIKNKILFVSIISPLRLRRNVLFLIGETIKQKNVIINIKSNKCFNGCRPSKKKRKKQKGQRFFK